jgi:prepilin-type N-terminal cleavage/methylation domain-containing protein
MRGRSLNRKTESGVTLIEILVVMVILAALAAFAIPTFAVWLPNYRLKSAARDLYSNFQMAKMGAVNNNRDWAVIFDNTSSPGRYSIVSGRGENGAWDVPVSDEPIEKTVELAGYKGVRFGHGDAGEPVPVGGAFGDEITFGDYVAVFNPRGTGNDGYVYLQNEKNTAYAVGKRSSGVILLRKWTGSGWK